MKIEFDYSFDTNSFFNAPERRAALEYAGEIWSNIIKDDFETIPIGAEFTITHPTTGRAETIVLDSEIDDLRIFVGSGTLNEGANLTNSNYHLKVCACHYCNQTSDQVVNLSQPGILNPENILDNNNLLAQAQINGTDLQGDIFQRRVSSNFRNTGEVTDFEPWSGTISFNPSNTINWNFDLENTNDSSVDFVSVALHEIGHILGIGVAPIFDALGANGTFRGVNALEVNNGAGIPLTADLSHVAEGFSNNTVLLDPQINANRNLPTDFDLAILADIGYEITGFRKQGSIPEIATEESEEILGSNLDDIIFALAGDDRIQGNEGNDTLNGGAGNDSIFGTIGDDLIFGNDGVDSLHGGIGADTINGGAGNDLLVGGEDADFLLGEDGDDEIQGDTGADTIQGGIGNDTLFGQVDNDLLLGNDGDDRLQGGDGNDILQGNNGIDTILGQAGDDLIDGGAGNDTLLGGNGSDRFYIDSNSGNDLINDFVVGEDRLEISTNLGFTSGNDLIRAITRTGAVTNSDGLFSEITLSEGQILTIFHDQELIANSFEIVTESSITANVLNVVDFTFTNSGFTIQFDGLLNTDTLDLSDITLIQESTGEAITGSFVWQQNNFSLSFIQSGNILESDRYNLTLASTENGITSSTGKLLDGDNDGIAGGNFVTQFTINNEDRRVLTLEDFNLPAGANTTLDIALDNGANLTQAEFTINYNADILTINDVIINPEIADDWTINTEDLSTPGIAIITVEGTNPLNSEAIDLVQLAATIPDNASYGVSDLLSITNITLNQGEITAIGDTALQTVAVTGDANGDGSHSHLDSYLISQMVVGLSESFTAFPGIDPQILADVNRDGIISALDSFIVAHEVN